MIDLSKARLDAKFEARDGSCWTYVGVESSTPPYIHRLRRDGSNYSASFTKNGQYFEECEHSNDLVAGLPARRKPGYGKVRHIEHGVEYAVLGEATIPASARSIKRGDTVVIYSDRHGRVWGRDKAEFNDGRFEALEEKQACESGFHRGMAAEPTQHEMAEALAMAKHYQNWPPDQWSSLAEVQRKLRLELAERDIGHLNAQGWTLKRIEGSGEY
jgi:hypothetical protein